TRLPAGVTLLRNARAPEATHVPKSAQARLARIACAVLDDEPVALVVLEGREGSGRTQLALDLANAVSLPLLRVDAGATQQALSAALLWQRLAGAVVLIDGAETWCARDE